MPCSDTGRLGYLSRSWFISSSVLKIRDDYDVGDDAGDDDNDGDYDDSVDGGGGAAGSGE